MQSSVLLCALVVGLAVISTGATPLTNAELRAQVAAYKADATDAEALYGPIADWDSSEVTDMSELFQYDYAFNGDISNWDTSKVTSMYYTFSDARAFNRDISRWDTSSVTTMEDAFSRTKAFNQDIPGWDTSSVTSMN